MKMGTSLVGRYSAYHKGDELDLGHQAGTQPPASLPALFEVELGAGGGLAPLSKPHWLLGLVWATEEPARAGGSLQPEGRAQAALEEGEARRPFTSLVQVLDAHVLWGQGGLWGCRPYRSLGLCPKGTTRGRAFPRDVTSADSQSSGRKGWGGTCDPDPESTNGCRAAWGPGWEGPHLQLQGRSLSRLHTCQAATPSLEPQEDGDLGAVQVSVRKDADLLWEEERDRR